MAMDSQHTTIVVQRYLDALAGDESAEPIVRALLDRSVRRLQALCRNMLFRQYRRLTLHPTNLEPDELLSAVVERLLKAMRSQRPPTVRHFFAMVNQHMRWELNDLARRLDQKPVAVQIDEGAIAAPSSEASSMTAKHGCVLQAIDRLPEEEREAFSLVRIQGLSYGEAAEVTGVSTKTVQRRLNRAMVLLSKELEHLRPT